MNLAFGHECEQFLIRNILSTLQRIAFSFDYSSKGLLAFQECFADNDAVREEIQRRTKLYTLCDTRWASRADISVHLSYSIQGCRAGFGEPSFGWRLQGKDLPMINKTF